MISVRDKYYEEESQSCVLNGKKIRYRIYFDEGFFENDVRINGIRVLMVKGEKGESGVSDYNELTSIPTLNGETITGDKVAADYHFAQVATTGLFEDLIQNSPAIIDCGTSTEVI